VKVVVTNDEWEESDPAMLRMRMVGRAFFPD
jgi:hypothetical protein